MDEWTAYGKRFTPRPWPPLILGQFGFYLTSVDTTCSGFLQQSHEEDRPERLADGESAMRCGPKTRQAKGRGCRSRKFHAIISAYGAPATAAQAAGVASVRSVRQTRIHPQYVAKTAYHSLPQPAEKISTPLTSALTVVRLSLTKESLLYLSSLFGTET
jgi:hypothetical protein